MTDINHSQKNAIAQLRQNRLQKAIFMADFSAEKKSPPLPGFQTEAETKAYQTSATADSFT